MKQEDQIKLINETINQTKENLKPLSFNLIFWGVLINIMSFVHYFFSSFIEQTKYTVLAYWIILPTLGMIYTIRWNIKKGIQIGYETIMGRTIKIIWGVFGFGWMLIVFTALINGFNPVPLILFLLGLVLMMNGLIIKFKPLTAGGIVMFMFIFSIISNPGANYLIINMAGVTLGMLIPGIFLSRMKVN
tara:strand:+ start:103 stop:669 length:567 start_codon:yes stop_codon:yes gene_type:complete